MDRRRRVMLAVVPLLAVVAVGTTATDAFAAAGIDLVKVTNGTNNGSGAGPVVPVGSTVTFTYLVTNTGDVELAGVTVVDDNGTPGVPGDDDTNGGDPNGAGTDNEPAINALARAGVISGTGGRNYDPSGAVSRAQFATFLVNELQLLSG